MIAPRSRAAGPKTYQLKLTLRGLAPPVWRRLVVPGVFTLDRLHAVIQIAMDWRNCHLHHFEIGDRFYGLCLEPGDEEALLDEKSARLDQVLRAERMRFRYVYDFADEWRHTLTVERIRPADTPDAPPRCAAGRRAAPPEGCGGTWAYEDLLAALADPAHPGHADAIGRTGGKLEPEFFDLDEINRRLAATVWEGDLPRL